MTGDVYWALLERTARRVDAWPDWKKGERSARKMLRQTHTYVVMEVSEATYREIAEKLVKAQYDHCFANGVGSEMDMTGIALAIELPQSLKIGTPIPEFYRASGDAICDDCGRKYYDHPMDKEELSAIDGKPYLSVLCNGVRVKL